MHNNLIIYLVLIPFLTGENPSVAVVFHTWANLQIVSVSAMHNNLIIYLVLIPFLTGENPSVAVVFHTWASLPITQEFKGNMEPFATSQVQNFGPSVDQLF